MNAEVMSMKQKSIDHINSVGFHQEMIAGCDTILQTLNPEYAEKQQQQAEINSLKDQMQVFSKSMTELAGLIADLRAEKRSSNPKKE
jgi:prefoldin subunit 5